MQKIIPFIAALGIGIVLSGCVKKPDTDTLPPATTGPAADFDWNTTKEFPVNVEAENGESIPIYIYDGTQLVASGYTPFHEKVTVPKSCTELQVAPMLMPEEKLKSLTKAITAPEYPIIIVYPDGSTYTANALNDFHNYLITEWTGRVNGQWGKWDQAMWDVYVDWWNTTSGGPLTQSSIRIYKDKLPKLVNRQWEIYHTCQWIGCEDNAHTDVTSPEAGTYIFEDLFPSMGDYEMNDFVVEENKLNAVGTGNKITGTEITYKINAISSAGIIAMAVNLLGVSTGDIEKIEMFTVDENGQDVPYRCSNKSGLFRMDGKGIETYPSVTADETVIPITDDAGSLLPAASKGQFFNTMKETAGGKGAPVEIKVNIAFTQTSNISISDFKTDVFIMPRIGGTSVEEQRGREIHVADAKCTPLVNEKLFNTGADASDYPNTSYRATNGYVWGIYLPVTNFRHPLEKVHLSKAYPEFVEWIESNGTAYQDWYQKPSEGNVWTW